MCPTIALPNRDSLKYAEQYGAADAHTFLRGTLRFEGFSRILDAITRLGLVDGEQSSLFAEGSPGKSSFSFLLFFF